MPNLLELARVRVIACSSYWDSTVFQLIILVEATFYFEALAASLVTLFDWASPLL